MHNGQKVSVVIPAYNEEATIAEVVRDFAGHPSVDEVVVVDNNCRDRTAELARQLAMHISFAAPEWATREEVPAEALEAERQIYLHSDEVLSKPEQARRRSVSQQTSCTPSPCVE